MWEGLIERSSFVADEGATVKDLGLASRSWEQPDPWLAASIWWPASSPQCFLWGRMLPLPFKGTTSKAISSHQRIWLVTCKSRKETRSRGCTQWWGEKQTQVERERVGILHPELAPSPGLATTGQGGPPRWNHFIRSVLLLMFGLVLTSCGETCFIWYNTYTKVSYRRLV